MSTNLSTANLPANFLSLDGEVLDLTRRELHEVPVESTVVFYADRSRDAAPTLIKSLTGLSAAQIGDVISKLPKNFHEDGQAAVPGRARNLVSSAIEDGWLVTITVRYRDVRVEFSLPTSTIHMLLQDLVTKAATSTASRPANQQFKAQYLTQGSVVYGWDWEAEAMRMDLVQDRRLKLSRTFPTFGGIDLDHRVVNIERHSDNDPSYGSQDKLTWREFTTNVHLHCPSLIESDLTHKQASKAARDAADAAFDGEAAQPARAALRAQLAGIATATEGRRETIAQAATPSLRTFSPSRSNDGGTNMMRRAAKYEAEGEVLDTVKRILDREGNWDGDRRVHIEEVLTTTMSKLTQRLLEITSSDVVVSSGDRQQDVYSTSHVIQTLAPLVRVNITTEVVV